MLRAADKERVACDSGRSVHALAQLVHRHHVERVADAQHGEVARSVDHVDVSVGGDGRMNDEKNELMGIAAHDLRNPLGAIKGFSELALEQIEELQPDVGESGHQGLVEVTNCARKIRDTSERQTGPVLMMRASPWTT